MIRVVLDTNILVSALLQPLGLSAQLLLAFLNGSLQLCVSGNIYAEYEEVIRRPRFKRSPEIVEATLESIRHKAHWFRTSEKVDTCGDPDDNIFLECPQAAEANYLVTGNLKTLPDKLAGMPNHSSPLDG